MHFFFCRVYVSTNIFLFLVLLGGAKTYILEEIQNIKDKRRKSNTRNTKAKTQNIEDKIQKTRQDQTRQDKFITLNPYTYGNMRNNGEIDDTRLDNI